MDTFEGRNRLAYWQTYHSSPPRLFVAPEGRLRAFLRTLVPSLDDLDEVMQETSLVAWRKFAQFEPGTDFLAWVATIGRFEALRWRRDRAADRLVFGERLCELLADEALAETETREAERRALDVCLEKLPARQRQWLSAAYQPGAKFREVARIRPERSSQPVEFAGHYVDAVKLLLHAECKR